jgi:hypothetical protein
VTTLCLQKVAVLLQSIAKYCLRLAANETQRDVAVELILKLVDGSCACILLSWIGFELRSFLAAIPDATLGRGLVALGSDRGESRRLQARPYRVGVVSEVGVGRGLRSSP